MPTPDLHYLPATTLAHQIREKSLSARDLMQSTLARIAEVNPTLNAIPTLIPDQALTWAEEADERQARGAPLGPLHGLPIAHKDLVMTAGIRTTMGSRLLADNFPKHDDLIVQRLRAAGAITIGKTNTPEFGAGSQTFNEVFGATLNPWNLSRSASGSSGGAAAALATGTAWLAHGTDVGGSLRNPASFCGVVGMRPSIGRVAHSQAAKIDRTLSADGPMARNVEDLALMLDAMSGEHPGDALSLPRLPTSFLAAARSGAKPKRIAYSADLGISPVDPEVAEITRKAAQRFAEADVIVEEAHPDFSEAVACAHVLRAYDYVLTKGKLLKSHRDQLKPEVIWNIEEGLKLTLADIERAEAQRVTLMNRALAFFETYDLLLCPTTIVAPFPVEQRYLAECNGVKFDNYVGWLAIVSAITIACCPAMSIPCGFTREGLPVGLQIVAAPRGEARVLAGGKLLETVLGLGALTPIDPRPGK